MQTLNVREKALKTTCRLSFLFFDIIIFGALGISFGAVGAAAQSSERSAPASTWTSVSASPGEVTVLGTIRQVVANHAAGGPAGVHVLIDGPLGSFDASLGSSLPGEVLQALSDGGPVQMVGAVRSANGKTFLFVRQLNVAGHQVTIRNSNGFLVRSSVTSGSVSNKARESAGGVQ
jgi:hypothetical protein